MRLHWYFALGFAAATLPAAAGCGSKAEGTSATPAAINGSDGQNAQSAADSAGSTGQSDTDALHPVVELETSLGNVTVELDAEKAPLTVDNFLGYVDNGHYDQTIFHQVIKDYPKLVLGGAYTSEGVEKKTGSPIYNEAHNGLKNLRGTIAMARQADATDSATCHFFLNLSDNDVLDHQDRTLDGYGYCVFGKVIDGMDVVDRIGDVEVRDTEQFERTPVDTVMIKSVHRVQ